MSATGWTVLAMSVLATACGRIGFDRAAQIGDARVVDRFDAGVGSPDGSARSDGGRDAAAPRDVGSAALDAARDTGPAELCPIDRPCLDRIGCGTSRPDYRMQCTGARNCVCPRDATCVMECVDRACHFVVSGGAQVSLACPSCDCTVDQAGGTCATNCSPDWPY